MVLDCSKTLNINNLQHTSAYTGSNIHKILTAQNQFQNSKTQQTRPKQHTLTYDTTREEQTRIRSLRAPIPCCCCCCCCCCCLMCMCVAVVVMFLDLQRNIANYHCDAEIKHLRKTRELATCNSVDCDFNVETNTSTPEIHPVYWAHHREREREREIITYIHVYTYVYIYIYIERERERETCVHCISACGKATTPCASVASWEVYTCHIYIYIYIV